MRFESLLLPAFAAAVYACGGKSDAAAVDPDVATDPSAVVADEGWRPLFDGATLDGWHTYGGEPVGEAWKVGDDGSVYLDVSNKADGRVVGGGDIVSDESFENYELELEWKIAECGNSGIIYNVLEEEGLDYPWQTGPEMQVLDNTCHPDAKIYKHKAGDLYDLISSADSLAAKPAGEWNTARLVNRPGQVEHWLNGEQQVSYDNTGEEWKAMIAGSKFKDMPRFGSSTSGKISLQDHGDAVWYRNVRVREL